MAHRSKQSKIKEDIAHQLFPRPENQIYRAHGAPQPAPRNGTRVNNIPAHMHSLPPVMHIASFGSREGALRVVDDFSKLYTSDRERGNAQAALDTLSMNQKQRLVLAYLYCFTSFDGDTLLDKVSAAIESHAKSVMRSAQAKLGIEVAYSGYDSASSIGRRIAIPGSDLDHWTIVVRGTKRDAECFRAEIHAQMNPLISDVLNSSHRPPLVVAIDSIKGMLTMKGGSDSYYLYKLPLAEWEQNVAAWRAFDPSIPKPFVASSDAALAKLKATLKDDACREDWVLASCALEILRDGATLANAFTKEELAQIKGSRLFATSDILKQKRNSTSLQSKHRARGSLETFHQLSVEEQFLLLRVIFERHLWKTANHQHLLSLSERNPHRAIVEKLLTKDLLVYADPIIDPSCPAETPRNYKALKPYLKPGTMARAAWLDHIPFDRSLPLDY